MSIKPLLDYMYKLERFGIKLGLEVITSLLKALGNPEKDLKVIHIAGTNGKGSVAAMIESIIRTNGKTTGLYTSPHITKFNERIKFNNKEITNEDITELVEKIKTTCEINNIQATFFEFTTALALLYFSREKPDYVILETGLGGRLDATNTCNSILTLITNISFDHMKYLGDSKVEIAKEKAGIIKSKIPLITTEKDENLKSMFKDKCKELESEFCEINDEFEIIDSNLEGQRFKFEDEEYELKLLGEHQITNACLAIKAIKLLGINSIKEGLKKAYWPGRIEIVKKDPTIIIDSAHNYSGMKELIKFLKKYFPKVTLVLGMSKNKEHKRVLKEIIPYTKKVILTKGTFMGEEPTELQMFLDEKATIITDPKQAVEKAIEMAGSTPILITGSIYMIGDVYKLFLP